MKLQSALYLIMILLSFNTNGQSQLQNDSFKFSKSQLASLNDGPYVFINDEKLLETRIVNGKITNKELPFNIYPTDFKPEKSIYQGIDNLVVLSDIHGQYDLAVELFKNNKIIDKDLNWNFGQGHLVIVGDVFDRGPKVNEMLWLIYKLDEQAKLQNGRVHLLLGNHEYMILHSDLRYLHEKYNMTMSLLNMNYSVLYGKQTVLGRWLRSKATILKINQYSFVHGGISKQFLTNGYDLETINQVMRRSIDRDKSEMKTSDFYKTYYGSNSPIWYRGLILDNLGDEEVSNILNKIGSEHIVVGHCSNKEIIQLNNYKIFGVDSSIKYGEYGELLFIENGGDYYRGTLEGKKIKL